jgi:hypothetical protein
MPQNWLRTDEKENAVDSLEMTAEFLIETVTKKTENLTF